MPAGNHFCRLFKPKCRYGDKDNSANTFENLRPNFCFGFPFYAIINTSRGLLINTDDLIDAIKEKIVGAACLDVYEEESDLFFEDNSGHILEDDTLARLISMPNVIVTSHQAFLTEEALENIAQTTVMNLVHFFQNNQCANELCFRSGTAEDCKDGKCF